MKGQTSRIQAAEMRFLRHVAGYTLHDHRGNADIWQELNIMSILYWIVQYRLNWWEQLCRKMTAASPTNSGTLSQGDGEV